MTKEAKHLREGYVMIPDKEYCKGCLFFGKASPTNTKADYRCKSDCMAGRVIVIDVEDGEDCPCREKSLKS